jgi:hypothetical protein
VAGRCFTCSANLTESSSENKNTRFNMDKWYSPVLETSVNRYNDYAERHILVHDLSRGQEGTSFLMALGILSIKA